jgi:hypothetical protein
MPKQRYQSREPTHDWQQIRPTFRFGEGVF